MLAALCLCLLLGLGPKPAQLPAEPIEVDLYSFGDHRIAGETQIRPGGGVASYGSVRLDLTVDEQGRVVAVVPSGDYRSSPADFPDAQWLEAATKAARAWRFRPFLRDGKPAPARGMIEIALLPRERLPTRHVPFPDVPRERIAIRMNRTGCYGSCPPYSVTIFGDGRVEYEGGVHALVQGSHAWRIKMAKADALIRLFREADFWSLEPRYEARITDSLTTMITVKAGGRSKTVTDYVGTMVGMPDAVIRLEEAVDEAADTAALLTGNERTIRQLEAERFDFRSREATEIFVRSIGLAPEALALALLDRGVSLDRAVSASPYDDRSMEPAHGLAVSAAVRSGRLRLFDRLDRMGALKKLKQAELDRLLIHAAFVRSPHLVERLLALGARSRATDLRHGSALVQALADVYDLAAPDADQEAIIRLLLRRGVSLEAKDSAGWSALQHAYDDDPKYARMLIAAGANVDAAGDYGEPLVYMTENEEIALIAIEAGANLGLKDSQGRSLPELARSKRWRRVQALLARRPARR